MKKEAIAVKLWSYDYVTPNNEPSIELMFVVFEGTSEECNNYKDSLNSNDWKPEFGYYRFTLTDDYVKISDSPLIYRRNHYEE